MSIVFTLKRGGEMLIREGYTRNIKMKYRNNVIYINSPNTLPNQYSPNEFKRVSLLTVK